MQVTLPSIIYYQVFYHTNSEIILSIQEVVFIQWFNFSFLCTCDIEMEFENSWWLLFLIEVNIYPGLNDYQIYFPPETV